MPETPSAPSAPAEPAKPAVPAAPPSAPSAPSPKKPSRAGTKAAKPAQPAEKKSPIRPRAAAAKPATPAAAPKPSTPSSRLPPGATVVDASGLVLGRAASLIAQRLLKGEAIVVVHADRSVITGARAQVISFYTANRARGSKRTGPHFPRYPDRIFRRTVRGMLPHLKTRGKLAYDRLEVHIGCPDGVKPARPEWLGPAAARPAVRPPITLGEVSRLLGARV